MQSQQPSQSPLSEVLCSRVWLLALGWTVGGMVATAILAGLLNGLNLVDGQDMVVTFWTGIFVALGVITEAWSVHRSTQVAIAEVLLVVPASLLVGFLAIVTTYGQWAR